MIKKERRGDFEEGFTLLETELSKISSDYKIKPFRTNSEKSKSDQNFE